jgi:alkylresorcinol/alkylpyrone synthase
VLEALDAALNLAPGAFERSWRLLGATGNLYSASVLFVLRDLLDSRDARPADL